MRHHEDLARQSSRRTATTVFGHPLFPSLAAIPLVCFAGALLTDIVYARTPHMQWTNFSAWLITAGLIFALFAAVVGVVDFVRNAIDLLAIAHVTLVFAAYVTELFNMLVHSRDAYTSVVPTGLALSIVAVVLLLVGNGLGARLHYRPTETSAR